MICLKCGQDKSELYWQAYVAVHGLSQRVPKAVLPKKEGKRWNETYRNHIKGFMIGEQKAGRRLSGASVLNVVPTNIKRSYHAQTRIVHSTLGEWADN